MIKFGETEIDDRVTFTGTKKTNEYGVPNGASGIVKKKCDTILRPSVLVQFNELGVTAWVKIEELSKS